MSPVEAAVLIAAMVLVVLATAVAAARSKRSFRAANEVVPGVKSPAPDSWAGSHTPEARLHRRLRDAVRALRAATPSEGDINTGGFRSTVEREALALDERLVAVAALPQRVRAEPLAQLTEAVEALEDAAAVLATSMGSGPQALPRAVADVTERLRLLGEARHELEESYAQEITRLDTAVGEAQPEQRPASEA